MIEVINLKEMPQGIMKLGGSIEILPGKHMSTRVFPKSLDNVEVMGIWRQKYEVDIEFQSFLPYGLTILITGIVKNVGDRSVTCGKSDLLKECLCLPGIHIYHGMGMYEVKGKRIYTTEKIKAISSYCRLRNRDQ